MNKVIAIVVLLLPLVATADTFRIGAVYPEETTGYISSTSGPEASCITKAAVAEARKSGVDVVLESIKLSGSPLAAVESARIAVAKNSDAVVGTIFSDDAIPAAEIFEQAKVPFVVPMATSPRVTQKKQYVTRIAFNDLRQAQVLAGFAKKEFSPKKVTVIRNISHPYSNDLGLEFAKVLRELSPGVVINDVTIIDGFTSWRDLVSKIVESEPELVFVPIYQGYVASLYAELNKYDRSIVLLGSDTIEKKPQFLSLFPEKPGAIRFIYPHHWDERLHGPAAKRYAALKRKYCPSQDISMGGAYAYDAIEVILSAVRKHPKARGLELMKAIHSLGFVGAMGPLRYGADGDPLKPVYFYELRGRNAELWGRVE